MTTQLTLGTVDFQAFELPETIDHFVGIQKIVVHDFPGGERTIQPLGAFPPREIRWSGQFLAGDVSGQPQDRVDLLNTMRIGQQQVTLNFAAFQYLVMIQDFQVHPRGELIFPYSITLVPIADQTASSTTAPPIPTAVPQLAQSAAQLRGPISQAGQLPTAAQNTANVAPGANTPIPSAPPPGPVAAVTNFQSTLQAAIQASLGQLDAIDTPDVQASLLAAQSAVLPLGNSPVTDLGTAAFGLTSAAAIGVIANELAGTNAPITTINAVNPNLMALALQYYGSANQWTLIAEANKISVPNPVGIFQGDTAIVIPSITQ